MNPKLKTLDNFLNQLLIFLLPSQLAIHFWPGFAFVFGIRVDYFAPTLYFTDILFLLVFIPWLFKNYRHVFEDVKNALPAILILVLIFLVNIYFSINPLISFLKFLKFIEMFTFGYYVYKRNEIFNLRKTSKIIFLSALFFCSIGIIQFLNGKTSGKLFYLFGERSFSVITPGIALVNLFGKNFLRIYSTFPHPNSLAGYLGLMSIFLTAYLKCKKIYIKTVGLLLLFSTFVLSFSLSGYVALFVCLLFFLMRKKISIGKNIFGIILITVFLLSFCLSWTSTSILQKGIVLPLSFIQRIQLAEAAGKIFSSKMINGTGMNTFILAALKFATEERGVWFLQPVHNIYLLTFCESGIIGLSALFISIYLLIRRINFGKEFWFGLMILFFLITGLFDHYWITIQQNLLVLSFLIGTALQKKE